MARRKKDVADKIADLLDAFPTLSKDVVKAAVARKARAAIRKAANSAAWDGYGYACNGVLPAGMEVMFGKSAAKRRAQNGK